jgi:hypothetical protein
MRSVGEVVFPVVDGPLAILQKDIPVTNEDTPGIIKKVARVINKVNPDIHSGGTIHQLPITEGRRNEFTTNEACE